MLFVFSRHGPRGDWAVTGRCYLCSLGKALMGVGSYWQMLFVFSRQGPRGDWAVTGRCYLCSVGKALMETGESYREMADIKYSLEDNVKQNFIEPLLHLQTKDLKEVNVRIPPHIESSLYMPPYQVCRQGDMSTRPKCPARYLYANNPDKTCTELMNFHPPTHIFTHHFCPSKNGWAGL